MRVKSLFILIIAMTLFAALALPVQLAAQHTKYKFIDIGTLGGLVSNVPGNGSEGLSNNGIVVGSASTPDAVHAFSWQNGVITDLGTLPSSDGTLNSSANGVNARGWVVGYSNTGGFDPLTNPDIGEQHAVLWKNGEIIDLGTLGGKESFAGYVNNGGQVVGISTINDTPDPFSFGFASLGAPAHAFIWQNGVMRDLGTLGGPDSAPSVLCANERMGLIAGFSLVNASANDSTGLPTQHAFLWQNGSMRDISTLGGTFAYAQCANNRGQVIGQSSLTGDPGCDGSNPLFSCNQHAFLWERGSQKDLETLGGSFSQAIWLNNVGEAVGGATTTNDESFHATIWKDGRITDLGTLDGDCFSFARAINSKSHTHAMALLHDQSCGIRAQYSI